MGTNQYIKDGVFDEPFYDDAPFEVKTGFKVKEILYDGKSEYQDILIFKRYLIIHFKYSFPSDKICNTLCLSQEMISPTNAQTNSVISISETYLLQPGKLS